MDQTPKTELYDILTERDVAFLSLLDDLAGRSATRPVGIKPTLLDLDAVVEALEGDQPRIVYQPIVDLASGATVSYEALSRFHDGVGPHTWFATAHAVGLGPDLELKAIAKALEAVSHLPSDIRVSVNAGASTLASGRLDAVLEGVPGSRVTVEITEHEVVTDYDAVAEVTARLRRRGCLLAVDDAGAGCAGLTHLLELRPDIVKLDRSIVTAMHARPRAQSVASSVVALADHWGATVVAEGVETPRGTASTAPDRRRPRPGLALRPPRSPRRRRLTPACHLDGRCLPAAVVAGDDVERHVDADRDRAGAVGDLGAVEEQLAAVLGPDRAVALVLVEVGDDAGRHPS